jgi:acyl-CoA reductase-like NAD-dependent aldehyde dehydrogenase
MDQAVALSATGALRNQGQVCCAATRMFVQESICESLRTGPRLRPTKSLWAPLDRATTMGPLVSSEQHERVLDYLKLAGDEGAQAKADSVRGPQAKGYFVKPTIYTHVKNDMRIAKEIFGPARC